MVSATLRMKLGEYFEACDLNHPTGNSDHLAMELETAPFFIQNTKSPTLFIVLGPCPLL